MGGSKSKLDIGRPGATEEDLNFLRSHLHLTGSDVSRLVKSYAKFDLTKDGAVHFDEFCARLRVEVRLLLIICC